MLRNYRLLLFIRCFIGLMMPFTSSFSLGLVFFQLFIYMLLWFVVHTLFLGMSITSSFRSFLILTRLFFLMPFRAFFIMFFLLILIHNITYCYHSLPYFLIFWIKEIISALFAYEYISYKIKKRSDWHVWFYDHWNSSVSSPAHGKTT